MLAEEPRTVPGVSIATLDRWRAEALLSKAGGARLTPAAFRRLLKPEGMCLACEQLGEYQRVLVRSFARTLEAGDPPSIREAYVAGDGLCLPHLRLALGLMDDRDTANALAQHFLISIRSCATGLERFLAASASPASLSPASTPPDVRMRAVERCSGRLGR
jgi:hypothetical protein